jgi:hypothetical protein
VKRLIIPILLILCLTGYSQNRIGKNISSVRAEYADKQYNLRYVKHDTSAFLVIQDKYASIIHRFGADSLCNKTYVTLPDTLIANQVANTYDIIYEPLSSLEWIVRLPNDVLDVELVTTTNRDGLQQPTFQWTRKRQ